MLIRLCVIAALNSLLLKGRIAMFKFNTLSVGFTLGGLLGVASGVAIGSVLGFLGGMLLAPKSGSELREQLKTGSQDLYDRAAESIEDAKSKTYETISKVKSKGQEFVKLASEAIPTTQG